MLPLAACCAIAHGDHAHAPRDRQTAMRHFVDDCGGAGCANAARDAATCAGPARQGVNVSGRRHVPAYGGVGAGRVIWVSILAVLWVGAALFVWALAVMAGRGDEELQREREAAEANQPGERFSRGGAPVRPRARARP
jgi:hypothetical protein